VRVVVIGGGFGGIQAVKSLAGAPVGVTLVDRRNFHLFQPLLYQVATGALSPAEIATPLRSVFKRRRNVRVLLAEVTGFDLERRIVRLGDLPSGEESLELPYDALVVSAGSRYSYFGHDDWQHVAPELKSLEGALQIRTRILAAFEAAEVEPDPDLRRAWLTFVVVGGGPTGVEIAGQIAELARDTLRRDFRSIDPRETRVLLVETADRVLTGFAPSLSGKAAGALERLGVSLLVGHTVVDIEKGFVDIESGGSHERTAARTVIWAAGVTASALAGELAHAAGLETDRAGRVPVGPELTLAGRPEVFAIGDMVGVTGADGSPAPLPGLAPVAMQQGRYVGRVLGDRLRGMETEPFHYVDKGNLATIGRANAVAEIKGLRLSGFVAWVTWLFVHLFYLIGFQNRLLVFLRWTFSFLTHGRGARLITGEPDSDASLRR
jgi:NADH:quinone reductase (non-electrogenic)